MIKSLSLAALLFLSATICFAQSGMITTFAGNGSIIFGSYSGDGGPALAAGLSAANMSFDALGNMYLVDNGNAVVRKINTAGIITTVAGPGSTTYGDGGPATAALISGVSSIAIDISGNMFITNSDLCTIRKIDVSGTITTIAGSISTALPPAIMGVPGYTGDGGPATAALLNQPLGIVIDGHGSIYFTDQGSVIRKINSSGVITTIAGTSTTGFSGDGGPATAASLNNPGYLAVDGAGNIYFSDVDNARVRKISPSGMITTVAGNGTMGYGGDGGAATAASIDAHGIAIDQRGNIFFSDNNNSYVRKINTAGIITTVAGNGSTTVYTSGDGGPATAASIMYAFGLTFDAADNLYVSTGMGYIRKITTPDIVADSFSVSLNKLCNGLQFWVTASSTSSLSVKTFFGDGSVSIDALGAPVSGMTSVNVLHAYSAPGTYTIKMVLFNGSTPIDSVSYPYNFLFCNTLSVQLYNDANNNCVKDITEIGNYLPVTFEVDSNGVAIDSISATCGFNYTAYGSPGDVYSFRLLPISTDVGPSCPISGVITDTLQSITYPIGTKYLGMHCGSSINYDLGEIVHVKAGKHEMEGDIFVRNTYCNPQAATVTMNMSPKYTFGGASPAPSSVSGNTYTWNLGTLSMATTPPLIQFYFFIPGAWLLPGDTVHSDYMVSPVSSDIDPTNNTCIRIDTVRSSYDPNEITVTPGGEISSGTRLQYTIQFENTGNDTAQNIYVMDTLSDHLVASSFKILANSAPMNVIPLSAGGRHILKFDFPGIKLLDSSYHNQCHGMLVYTIDTRTGLPDGTVIPNSAGIYFDDNPVVLTNTVTNIIKIPVVRVSATENQFPVHIYPSPATDELTIKMDQGAYTSFTITNSIGQKLVQQTLNNLQTKVNINTLSPGLYYITFKGEHGIVTRKFVKK